MDPDLLLVIGIIIGVLSIPSMLSAFAESRAPRAASVVVLIAGVLIVIAVSRKVGGYEIAEIPDVFFRVIGNLVN
jgi:hypothetical protein